MRRRSLLILALAAAVALAAATVVARERTPSHRATVLPPSAVSLVGDSLNLGTEPALQEALPRWTFHVDDVVGRATATGLERLRAAGESLAPYVVVSLGTNDPVAEVDAFRMAIAEALRIAGPNRCVVWATIHRDGNAYDSFNGVLRAAAKRNRNVRLVEWAEMIDKHPEWLASDGIHGNPDGYVARAEAVVAAMRSCHEAGVGR
jgi:lysophospholipase L1-like esterase